MFGLLKAAWQSESADKRLQAIQKMDARDAANQAILLNLASSDPESDVRHSAISQLNSPSDLFNISQTHADESTRSYAESTLHQLIGTKSSLTEAQFQQLYSTHAELKLPIAMVCPHANVRQEIVQSLTSSEQVDIIAKVEYTNTRQLIAQQLTDIKDLEQARKLLKGKDKSAEKVIKSKLHEHHVEQQQQQEFFSQAQTICEKMEYIASHNSHPDFHAMFNVWSQRWEALEFTPDTELNTRYLTAHDKAKQDVIYQEEQKKILNNQQSLVNNIKNYCQQVAALSWLELNAEKDNIRDTTKDFKRRWEKLLLTASNSSDNLNKQFTHMQNALLSLSQLSEVELNENTKDDLNTLGKTINMISWPPTQPPSQALEEAKARRDELEKNVKQDALESENKLNQLHKRINRLIGSTKRGNIGQAKRELAAITQASSHFSGKDKTVLDERLQKAGDAVEKMGDWKDFATEPKFLALCDAMEALTTTNLHPDALAAKISKLQKSWKSLGYSDCADQYWDRFKEAADKAYEPCAVFFAQRHEIRKNNLEKREPLVTQMQKLHEDTHWDDIVDYKPIESELNSIIHTWKKIKDVERDAGQDQWNRLSVFKSAIYEKLDRVYDDNIESKNQLIEQVKKILDSDINDDTLDKLKSLQTRWKQIGITRRKQDRAAWKDFKETSDAVYAKLQDKRKAKREEEDSHLAGYREIIQKIRQLGKSQTSLNEADKAFEQLQTDYQALPSLPKNLATKLAERLDNDFKQACDSYTSARSDLKESEYQQAVRALSKKAKLCTELEKSTSTEEIECLNKALNAVEIPNSELKRRFDIRLNSAQQTDRSQANQARQKLCLDLEILLNVESPAEEKALRMQTQLERMKDRGIGQTSKDLEASLQEYKIDWLCLPGADPELQASLEERFQDALKNSELD